ncbi:hypothetical protein QQF73_00145 [Marinobacter sp. M216]|uniref:DUF6647 domain-containing protein n=1 Tax=Marinobacter albus TaxID=3030833 RepID=A0ABT7H7U9_9GAMM|nr:MULTISPECIES: DUF6647 family protein [unclassified Marinobacter]MBW7471670.1 hypothetical protein [Marinobacter sp. F4218]MDK9556012.1 hypothetical protein [Marinobacter sp. M216]
MLLGRANAPVQSDAASQSAITVWVFLLWLVVILVPVAGAKAEPHNARAPELSALADTLSDWIIGQTRFSETELPDIEFKTQIELAELSFPGFSHDLLPSIRGAYDARSVVIYLNTSFDSDSLLDNSYLLHELMHHFQVQNLPPNLRGSKPAMEAEALRAQLKWLEQNGVPDGMRQLDVDEKTLRMLEASPR